MEIHLGIAGSEIDHGEQRKREDDVCKHELAGSLFAPGQWNLRKGYATSRAQQRRQTPHDAQHPPPPQPPQPQPRAQPRQPRQPRHPRQPPQRQPQAICWKPALPPFSLSNRWKVERLTSAISSSPSNTDCDGEKFSFCGVSAVGSVDAEAPPASEKVNPAAPNAGATAFAARFRLEACFTDIVASPPYL